MSAAEERNCRAGKLLAARPDRISIDYRAVETGIKISPVGLDRLDRATIAWRIWETQAG